MRALSLSGSQIQQRYMKSMLKEKEESSIKRSLKLLLILMTIYIIFLIPNLFSWYEMEKFESKINTALGNFLTSQCKTNVHIDWVKIHNIPTGFLTIGKDSQEWNAQVTINSNYTYPIEGSVDGSFHFYFHEEFCGKNYHSDKIGYKSLDLKNKTFVDEYDQSSKTGDIGLKESNIILLTFFFGLIIIVFIISATIELFTNLIKIYKRKNE